MGIGKTFQSWPTGNKRYLNLWNIDVLNIWERTVSAVMYLVTFPPELVMAVDP